jgi:LmbE family N-acetylglucosaminyl deacetylase
MEKRTILVIGAHLDDCEIGAGGVIAKAVKAGHRVVLLNVASDYSTWRVTKGREKEVRQRLMTEAQEMGVEKRFLDYGYQQVPFDVEAMRRVAEVVVDVRPDITLMHDRNEREHAPSDHGTVGLIAEHAVRSADTLLGGLSVPYGREIYAFEVYPQREFRPDVFVDINDVLEPVVECINYFGVLYGESPHAKGAGKVESTIMIHSTGQELALGHYAAMKLCTAKFRGHHCGLAYAEAYRALDPAPLGGRLLESIL